MAQQVTLTKKGVKQIPNTTSAAVADIARRQALSASLKAVVEKNVLGYPDFADSEAYTAGTTVFYDRRLYTFHTDHAAGAWDDKEVDPADIRTLITDAITAALAAGTITPAVAENLANWNERDDLAIEDTFATVVRTAAGDASINSEAGAQLVSIKPTADFAATALVTTGFNLLRQATAVGSGWYFLVPALPFGTYGTAEEPNGILFTSAQGDALTPTVRFKALSAGVPTSTSQGSVCAYTDSHGLRFYTTTEPGYLIVTGINRATTCAHVGWSRRYQEYVGIDNVNDAGGSVALTDIIAACHDFGQLLVATRGGDTVADGITFGATEATWHRRVQRVKPEWTTTANDGEGGTISYTHTATIADMKAGGIVECGDIALDVNANAVSYTDDKQAATTSYVKYELATETTGTVTGSSHLDIEDWGLEILTGATGQAEVTVQYAQGYPDAVANLVNGGYQRRTEELEAQIEALKAIVDSIGSDAEGYVRVAGSSNPVLNYAHYTYGQPGGFQRDSVFSLLSPCLIGTKLSGDDAQVGKILHVLKKLGARKATAADAGFTVGQAVWDDLNGTPHAIDGSEGDVQITNTAKYHRIRGRHLIGGVEYDVFLVSPKAFTWQGIESEEVAQGGVSPDYCVSHTDTDGVVRMHSVYNPDWDGSYTAPDGVEGKYIVTEQNGVLVENYDADATLLGGAGGLSTTGIDLPTGELHAMNQNPDTTKMVPFANQTAASVENWFALMLSEGGTFDAHKAALMGSGFSANDGATTASDWEESAAGAKNGIRVEDKSGTLKMFSPAADIKAWWGKTDKFYAGQVVNSYRTPWHIMEAHRAVCHAIRAGIPELQWFAFEGNRYKWRSIDGFAGPQQGEMTCVVFKMLSGKCKSNVLDPTDKETSLEGHRIDFLFSTALYHGITTQVSPSWWVSGLVFTKDENGTARAYMERDQEHLLKTPTTTIDASSTFPFEQQYQHVGTFAEGTGYRKNYTNAALMLPDSDTNKSGGGLHTYVGGYNSFTGEKAAAGKKAVRGFRRGSFVNASGLSPLFVSANVAPSGAFTSIAFGTCVRIVD